jgi:hypothetical protein
MRGGYAVDMVVAFRAEAEDGPVTEAEADGGDLFVLGLESSHVVEYLRFADLFVVAADEAWAGDVEFASFRYVFEHLGGKDLASEAGILDISLSGT